MTELETTCLNLGNVLRLRDTLRVLLTKGRTERFNMLYYFCERGLDDRFWRFSVINVAKGKDSPDPTRCGTAACLAGWAQLIGASTQEERAQHAGTFAQRWLGIPAQQSSHWFGGGFGSGIEATLEDALEFLDGVIATGDPNYTLPEEKIYPDWWTDAS
jgi:hypothetical protein